MLNDFIDSKTENKKEEKYIELKSTNLKLIGDKLIMKVYIGQNDSIVKEGTIIDIYDKGKYNMLLCRFKGKKGGIYHSCAIQFKDTLLIY